jgi:hypothetical protein
MQLRSGLSLTLMALLPASMLAPACSSGTSLATRGQLITCTTDPTTGDVVSCAPDTTGSGAGSGSGTNTCQDVDQDGDGEPHDQGDDSAAGAAAKADDSGDRDHDGIPDDRDCDERPGEDGDRDGLPYDVRPALGASTRPILDAFAAHAAAGAAAPTIVSIAMEGDTWRLTELQAGTAFVVTQADCDHAGNRGTGRDRVVVTWKNADQTQASDHLDIRYCDSN